MSSVCSQHDVTLHHLKFRSHGCGDEDENVASLRSWATPAGSATLEDVYEPSFRA